MANKRIDEPTGTETVGHEWDGIEELDTPMPRWWLITLYITIAWGVVYVVLYPAWPMLGQATEGVLGWSSRGQLTAEMARESDRKAPVLAALASVPIEQLPENTELMRQAVAGDEAFLAGAQRARAQERQLTGARPAGRATPTSTTTIGSGAAT